MNTHYQTVLAWLEANNAPTEVIDALGALAPAEMYDPNPNTGSECKVCGGAGCDDCDKTNN